MEERTNPFGKVIIYCKSSRGLIKYKEPFQSSSVENTVSSKSRRKVANGKKGEGRVQDVPFKIMTRRCSDRSEWFETGCTRTELPYFGLIYDTL